MPYAEINGNPATDVVDFILDESIAIEVKATSLVSEKHLKGLKAFSESNPCKRQIVISRDKAYRKLGQVEIYPYEHFLSELWAGNI